ncbi:exodeoxyribonuclease VII, small subunit [Polaromonas sp. CF318]|jgi:exodeoxyribonuclease VII small subunit|uniref:exodeoxyribonuclease VII small subunit n=1 Tax=unclassified Polaromonas TaxID=2638319 RepID=UPI0002710887|nr:MULTISPECIES: exodeoxyribonuclease VII small subunit [unclassified Polaromonas]EJL86218.1 exodeoxyribonuclease VII, small subunit [Polaromonas sp. CF318]SDM85005.1 Exodeoxyribonuclease VII small subunit [Polaromonas sp. JS666]
MAKSASSSASSTPPAAALPASYEAALQELEELVDSLESGQLPLDQLLTGYQRGAQLLKFCRDKLEAVETQIKVLEGTELKPWVQE